MLRLWGHNAPVLNSRARTSVKYEPLPPAVSVKGPNEVTRAQGPLLGALMLFLPAPAKSLHGYSES